MHAIYWYRDVWKAFGHWNAPEIFLNNLGNVYIAYHTPSYTYWYGNGLIGRNWEALAMKLLIPRSDSLWDLVIFCFFSQLKIQGMAWDCCSDSLIDLSRAGWQLLQQMLLLLVDSWEGYRQSLLSLATLPRLLFCANWWIWLGTSWRVSQWKKWVRYFWLVLEAERNFSNFLPGLLAAPCSPACGWQ